MNISDFNKRCTRSVTEKIVNYLIIFNLKIVSTETQPAKSSLSCLSVPNVKFLYLGHYVPLPTGYVSEKEKDADKKHLLLHTRHSTIVRQIFIFFPVIIYNN